MKRFLISIVATMVLICVMIGSAYAGGRGYYNGYNNGYRNNYNNAWAWGGAAFLGGAIIGGALTDGARPYYAPPPVYYAPPPVYYAPPPVYYAPPPVTYVDPNPAPVLYWDSVCQCYR
jgi:hypothetical protein